MSLARKGTGSSGHKQLVPEQCGGCLRTSLEEKPSSHGLWWCLGKGSGGSCSGRCCWRARACSRNKVPARARAGRARLEVGQADLLIQRRGKKRPEVKADGQILTFEAQI